MTDLDPDATLSTGPGAPDVDPTLLVGRYALGEVLGRGGSGQVHRATDTLTGDEVAVKFVRAMSAADRRQLRRELTALSLLDLPGVVRLLDDGQERGQTFLVMPLLPGGPLSSLRGRPFEAWAPAARSLVETLARVHYAGVIHRDLKPANILLDGDGRPVITDFGLAQGLSVERSDGTLEGTPRYMPPEQWAGLPCDERSDLYALGAVLWELCVGEPFPRTDRDRVLQAEVPRPLGRVVLRLVDPDPRARPASAEEVLEALGGGDAVLGPLGPLPQPVTREVLEALVDEARPTFQHLAEDTATLLLERSEGDPERVRQLLASWVRAGRCHWHEGRLRIDRASISALRFEGEGLGISGSDTEVAEAALHASESAWNTGHPGRALAVLESVLPMIEEPRAARRVRHRLAARAMFLNQAAPIRRALYQAQRAGDAPLTAVLQGARLCSSQEWQRAADLLRRTTGLPDELEEWRIAWLSHALGRLDRAAQVQLLTDVEAWCSAEPSRRARWLARWGIAQYASGRFAEALQCHATAADLLRGHPVERLTALANAACAALETSRPEDAAGLANEARRLGRALRFAVAESYASALLRAALYRAGSAGEPEPARVDAAAVVSPGHEAQHALIEAAVAWRAGSPQAVALASRAARVYARLAHPVQGLALALAAAAGATVDEDEVARLATALTHPTLALQAVALGAPGRAADLPVDAWVAGWHLSDPEARADVLSLRECLARLRAGSRDPAPGSCT